VTRHKKGVIKDVIIPSKDPAAEAASGGPVGVSLLALPAGVVHPREVAGAGPLTVHAPGASLALPALIADAGDEAARFTLEFFTARIPNPNTRAAYGRAILRFCRWCQRKSVRLRALSAPTVAAYVEGLELELGVPSVKLHLAGLRHWLDFLTEKGVVPFNPAASVRGPRYVVDDGKTPALASARRRATSSTRCVVSTSSRCATGRSSRSCCSASCASAPW
jgi:hypothetical protein